MTLSLERCFSLNPDLIQEIFTHAHPYGHNEDAESLNLGFGFVYYGLVRALRPKHVVVIGSGYGFSVVCQALALRDNGQGQLTFVDPSFKLTRDGPFKTVGGVGSWDTPEEVRRRFARFGVEEIITHYRVCAEEFFRRYDELGLPPIDISFIDGNHAYSHVKQDFVGTLQRIRRNGYILLHDTNIYIRELLRHAGVKRWMKRIQKRKDAFQLVDFPFASGVALVRVLEPTAWKELF